MLTREQKIARIGKIERIKQLEGSNTAPEISGETPDVAEEKPRTLADRAQSFLQGYGKEATMGYLPQLQALTQPAMAKVFDMANGTDVSKDLGDYTNRRDEAVSKLAMEQESDPLAFGAGGITGALSSSLVIPGGVGKNLGTWGKMGLGAVMGGTQGALYNTKDEKGKVDPLNLSERGENAILPAAIGAIIPGASAATKYLKGAFKNAASRASYKSLGPYARDAMKSFERGNVEEIGRNLIDEGIVGGAIPKSPEKIAKMAGEKANIRGQEIDKYIGELDDAAKNLSSPSTELVPHGQAGAGPLTKAGIDRQGIAQKMREELIESTHTDIPSITAKNAKMERLIQEFEKGGRDDLIPIMEAEMKKRAVGKEINWKRLEHEDVPVDEQVNRNLYGKLKQGVEDAGEFLEKKVGAPEVGKFKNLKKKYEALSTAERISGNRAAKDSIKQFLTPSIIGGSGAVIGAMTGGESTEDKVRGAMLGALAGVGHKQLRRYGNQILTTGFENASAASGGAEKVSNFLGKNPWAGLATLRSLRGD